jgi:hypothetical protein
MGKRDDITGRRTREFDAARLAALTKESRPDTDDEAQHIDVPAVGRAATIDDPLTTGLLAEVARRSQTTEFDDDLIQDVLTKIDSGETNHPHTRRRSSK